MADDRAAATETADDGAAPDAAPQKPDAVSGPDGPPSTDVPNSRAAVVEALEVRRNLRRGLAVGILTAVLAVLLFVLAPPATRRPTALYPLLAVVLATTSGALVATLLVANRARTLSREY